MADNTKIEWCDASWSPITGCSPISIGCENCHAKRTANRLRGRFGYSKDDPFRVAFHPDRLDQPLKWKKPRRIFVCSMGDIFHDDVQHDWIDDIFQIIVETNHIYLILTKRPNMMLKYFQHYIQDEVLLPDNLWVGVTAENQETAHERIPLLLQVPAAVRFVSVEPMLEKINIKNYIDPFRRLDSVYKANVKQGMFNKYQMASLREPIINWVIAGPETGPGARECKPEWIADLYEQCKAAGVPFFDKRKNYLAREFPDENRI